VCAFNIPPLYNHYHTLGSFLYVSSPSGLLLSSPAGLVIYFGVAKDLSSYLFVIKQWNYLASHDKMKAGGTSFQVGV
jgi:hypothetical protein